VDCFPCIRLSTRIALSDVPSAWGGLGRIARVIRRYYVPLLLRPFVKGLVLLSFAGVFVISVISIQHIQLGLGACCLYLHLRLQFTFPAL
jgi:Niemann-Pick C1 protein